MSREHLPWRRRAENFDFDHITPDGVHVPLRATLGFYEDGRLGEVFLYAAKIGTDLDVSFKDAAILLSFALQFGATTDDIRKSMTRNASGGPEGVIGTLLDLIATRPTDSPPAVVA